MRGSSELTGSILETIIRNIMTVNKIVDENTTLNGLD